MTNLFFKKIPQQGTKLYPYLCLGHDNESFAFLTVPVLNTLTIKKFLKMQPKQHFFAHLLYPEYMKNYMFPSSLWQHILKLIISFVESFIP